MKKKSLVKKKRKLPKDQHFMIVEQSKKEKRGDRKKDAISIQGLSHLQTLSKRLYKTK